MHVRVTQVVPLLTGYLSILPYEVPRAGSSETRYRSGWDLGSYVANSIEISLNRFLTVATVRIQILTVVVVLGRLKHVLLHSILIHGSSRQMEGRIHVHIVGSGLRD